MEAITAYLRARDCRRLASAIPKGDPARQSFLVYAEELEGQADVVAFPFRAPAAVPVGSVDRDKSVTFLREAGMVRAQILCP
jgi:hypothetical protein